MQPSRPISAKVSTDRSRPSGTVWRCRRTAGEVAPPVTDGERAGIQGWPNLASRLEAATIGVNRATPDTELDDLPEHFARYALEDRYVEAHVSKVLRANWKVDTSVTPWSPTCSRGAGSTRSSTVSGRTEAAGTFAAYVEDGIKWLHRRLDDYLKQG